MSAEMLSYGNSNVMHMKKLTEQLNGEVETADRHHPCGRALPPPLGHSALQRNCLPCLREREKYFFLEKTRNAVRQKGIKSI
jgi:hypothetical protein